MRRGTIIAGLICLNLGLLAGLAYVWKSRAPGAEGPPPPGGASSVETPSKTITRKIHVPAGQPEVSSRFTWRFIESTDFKQYIANLRAVGCPEQTIQDIIIAEVNKLYAGKEAELRLRPEHLKPWETFGVSTRVAMDRERRLRQLLREKRALLKDLLGIDVSVEIPQSFAGLSRRDQSRYDEALAKLPEGKREFVRAIQEQYWDKTEELEARTMGFWEAQDNEERRRLRAELRGSLAKTLTPDELLDYDIGTSSNASRYRTEMAAVNVTDQEFRELFKARHAVDEELNYANVDITNPEANRKRSADAQRALQETVKSILGEQRYADYQRSRDGQFRNLARLAQETGLPSETAIKAWDVQRLARDESNRLRSNPDLTPEQRDQSMRQMQAELDAAMTQLLGKEAFDRFQQNYGGARIFYERGTATFRVPPRPVAPGTVILTP
jgi:hypothetical protein